MSPTAAVLPASWLTSPWYATLTAFVAVNTLLYVVLSVSKILPRLHPTTWFARRNGMSRRRETRSIYPRGTAPGEPTRIGHR
jgi:hypothetical protein